MHQLEEVRVWGLDPNEQWVFQRPSEQSSDASMYSFMVNFMISWMLQFFRKMVQYRIIFVRDSGQLQPPRLAQLAAYMNWELSAPRRFIVGLLSYGNNCAAYVGSDLAAGIQTKETTTIALRLRHMRMTLRCCYS